MAIITEPAPAPIDHTTPELVENAARHALELAQRLPRSRAASTVATKLDEALLWLTLVPRE